MIKLSTPSPSEETVTSLNMATRELEKLADGTDCAGLPRLNSLLLATSQPGIQILRIDSDKLQY